MTLEATFDMGAILRKSQCEVNAENARAETCEIRNTQEMGNYQWIKDGLERTGKSQAGLARALGRDPAAVSRLLNGGRGLKAEEIEIVRRFLETPEPASVEQQPVLTRNVHISGATPDLAQHIRPATPMLTGARDVPIRGRSKGGRDGFFIDQGELLGMAYRPHILERVPDAYAVEIWDTSMEPALKHGHLALVHPGRRALPGDEVVVQLHDGQSFVKALVRRTEKILVLRQYNPPEEIKIEASKVKTVHLIVDSPRVRT